MVSCSKEHIATSKRRRAEFARTKRRRPHTSFGVALNPTRAEHQRDLPSGRRDSVERHIDGDPNCDGLTFAVTWLELPLSQRSDGVLIASPGHSRVIPSPMRHPSL